MVSTIHIQRARTKAFYRLVVDRLGLENWGARRAALIGRIRATESQIDLKKPIEPQLFIPAEDDIDWYILATELSHDFPYSDSAYSSRRIYPYAMAIGDAAQGLLAAPNVGAVLDKMLANNAKPETQIFELLTAAFYLKNGFDVSFVPENSILWADGITRKSPDLLVKMGPMEMYVECKRADKQTRYSQTEDESWAEIWSHLSLHMLEVAPWSIVDLTFHDQVSTVTAEEVIDVVDLAVRRSSGRVRAGSISVEIRAIDRLHLKRHYLKNSVRPNCPQHELLVFGDTDSNQKRSIATIATELVRPGEPDDVLNLFMVDIAKCVAAQWRCDHAISLERRSRHFKGLANDAISQIPTDKKGVVHIWYETVEGIGIEELRQDKNVENISNFDASGTEVLGVMIHGVNYYPKEDEYEWAETVQYFSRVPDLSTWYSQSLMLSGDETPEFDGTTHWEQDKISRLIR